MNQTAKRLHIHHSSFRIHPFLRSWVRETHEADDGADRAERDEEIEEGGHADDVLDVMLVDAVNGEDQPLQMVEQKADRGGREPARRLAEDTRPRETQHGGYKPAQSARAYKPKRNPRGVRRYPHRLALSQRVRKGQKHRASPFLKSVFRGGT